VKRPPWTPRCWRPAPRTHAHTQTYFSEVWVNRDESSLDTEVFGDLPHYLRSRVAQYVTTDLVLQVGVRWSGWGSGLGDG